MGALIAARTLSKTRRLSRTLMVPLLVFLAFGASGLPARDGQVDGGSMAVSIKTDTYVFLSDQSTVVQTGGVAGVNETHSIEGQFHLSVDFDKGVAEFTHVGARLTGKSGFLPTQDLGAIFNMGSLAGTVVSDTEITFEGRTADDTKADIVIRLSFAGDSLRISGQTIPPAGSADFFVFNLDAVARKKYGGGTGGPGNPYLIQTAEQMNAIGTSADDWDAHFKLTTDIDLSNVAGTAFNIIGVNETEPFTGEFDGDGYKVSNFNYTSADGDYIGLFGCVGWDGIIRDLGLIDPVVDAGKGDYVGPLVGCLAGGAVINCSAEGSVVSGKKYVGGLVGHNTVSTGGVFEILAAGTVDNSCAGGSVSGGQDIGGLAGANSGIITNCCSNAGVSGITGVGGLVGSNNHGPGPGTIIKCYSTGGVDGTARVGGLVGHSNGEVVDCFWDVQTSGQSSSDGGQGKTTAQMQTAATFLNAGWDLTGESANGTDDIWCVCEATNYPRLFWQIGAGDFVCPDGVTAADFLFFTEHWLDDNCDLSNDYCHGTDFDMSGAVDANDLAIFLDIWLANL